MAGIGTLVLMEHVTGIDGSVQANALRVEVSDPAAAAIIGQPFVIGHLSLSASPGTGPPEPAVAPGTSPPARAPARHPGARTGPAEPSTTTAAPLIPPAPLGPSPQDGPEAGASRGRAAMCSRCSVT